MGLRQESHRRSWKSRDADRAASRVPEEDTEVRDAHGDLVRTPGDSLKGNIRIPLSAEGEQGPGMKLDTAVGCLLVLMAMVLTRTGAVPRRQPLGLFPDAGGCHLAQFQSLSPQELQAFKRAKDTFEESLSLKAWSCRPRLFPRTWDLQQLQVWERPVALEAELTLTLKVLETMADRSQGGILDQPLHMLRHIRSELQACVEAQPPAGPQPRGRLHHWLHRLHEAPKKEPLGCLEASVTFNLFRLLTRDLKCVASGDLCV